MDAVVTWLPGLNACLNATSAACLALGLWHIKHGRKQTHRRFMLGALAASSLFLVGYLTRMALTGTHRFPAAGAWKVAYLALLFSHMILAVALLPMVLRTLFLAHRTRFVEHRRLAVWTWPVWMYVSVTGVVVYWLLYHVAPRLLAQG